MKTQLMTLAVISTLTALACEARTPVAGIDESGTNLSVTSAADASSPPASAKGVAGGSTCAPLGYPDDQPFTLPANVLGTWTGSFIDVDPAGLASLALEMHLEQVADGSYSVHVVLAADRSPPPAPTQATDQYPPGTLTDEEIPPPVIGGVDYPAHDVHWVSNVLVFSIAGFQGYHDWCSLQTSFALLSGQYNCIPGTGGTVVDAATPNEQCTAEDWRATGPGVVTTPVSCAQFFNCAAASDSLICTCDACGCSASAALNVEFQMTFTGDAADGTGLGASFALSRAAN